jgi:hypothetical protein
MWTSKGNVAKMGEWHGEIQARIYEAHFFDKNILIPRRYQLDPVPAII